MKTGSRMHNVGMKGGNINLAGQIFNTLEIPSIFAERDLFAACRREGGGFICRLRNSKEPK